MTNLFLFILLTCAGIWGAFAATQAENILHPIRKFGDKYLPWWLQKPLYDCPPCMASAYGIPAFLLFAHNQPLPFGFWATALIFVFAVSGINFIIKEMLFPYEGEEQE